MQNNKVYLVTGANAGIGYATALGLANLGATVLMVARSRERGEAAQAEIREASGNPEVALFVADLASQGAIRQLAADVKARYPALHGLINNAAVIPAERSLSEDGFELQFAVNHLAYFSLTLLLLDLLKASAPARIVNVASDVHHNAALNLDDLQSERGYDSQNVYNQTKLANVLFTYELARRLEGTGVTVNCLHPGGVATKLLAAYRRIPGDRPTGGISTEEGADTVLYLAASPEVEGVTGRYFRQREAVQSSPASHDAALARRLWETSLALAGLDAEKLAV
ncbi:MAG TPA: SDR family oxidoreductase [Ardenticatenaceae bacterium]|jgi:NAD(P)-dependent dehydrogenase (short-subunit alcohol dehydrogenase family)